MRNICTIPECGKYCASRGYCKTHYARWRRHGDPLAIPRWDPPEIRFWRHVTKTETCWLWNGAIASGYGHFMLAQQPAVTRKAHRYAYELLRGPITDGLTIDHLCKNKRCVNPDHLEAVTMRVNVLRNSGPSARNAVATHCINGHALTPDNVRIAHNNQRRCRACDREWMRKKRAHLRSLS